MIDDGTGTQISIPTIMIRKSDAQKIKAEIMRTEEMNKRPDNPQKEFVVLVVEFLVQNEDARVEVQVFYTGTDKRALKLFRDLRIYAAMLGNRTRITPHLALSRSNSTRNYRSQNCVRPSGEYSYCTLMSHIDNEVSGREKLMYGVKQMCAYKLYKGEKDGERWWRMMGHLYDSCEGGYGDSCLSEAMNYADVDSEKVSACALGDVEKILKDEYDVWATSHLSYDPSVIVNKHVYRVFF